MNSQTQSNSTVQSLIPATVWMQDRDLDKLATHIGRAMQEATKRTFERFSTEVRQAIRISFETFMRDYQAQRPVDLNPYGLPARHLPASQASRKQQHCPSQVLLNIRSQRQSSNAPPANNGSLQSSQSIRSRRFTYLHNNQRQTSLQTSLTIIEDPQGTIHSSKRCIFAARTAIRMMRKNVTHSEAKVLLQQIYQAIDSTTERQEVEQFIQLREELQEILRLPFGDVRLDGRDRLLE